MAKSLVPILQSLTSNQHTVVSSFSFAEKITNTSFPRSTVMFSFDVASLFTNILLDETVNVILDSFFIEADVISFNGWSYNRIHFKNLLEFTVKDNNFFLIITCMSR